MPANANGKGSGRRPTGVGLYPLSIQINNLNVEIFYEKDVTKKAILQEERLALVKRRDKGEQ